ncbi:DUF6094 domain-containing protein [Alicyclobacillus tolerans]|uniref:SAM-dependent methyltransferase n=1 Tax=Alicyclobacillus tolerans TaxID=90970 RepID=A0ABT9LYI0_9BACL|nr:DUF6094 domain-containing protein [Alicyclobacillus tengchongensis]MDP9729327.1 SAM-dependent methyltransferase [Alicyclobacillus tengchongensis]
MRLEGIAKAGYYPTPISMVEQVVRRLEPKEAYIRLLDPCCGTGEALERLAKHFSNVATYGVELDGQRAAEAQKRLDQVVHVAFERARIEKESMSLLFLNPPYDEVSGQKSEGLRSEWVFLRDTTKWLTPGGLLVYIIPRYVLTKSIIDSLIFRFTDIGVYRFTDREYAVYQQIVIFGQKRQKPITRISDLTEADYVTRNTLLWVGKEETQLPTIDIQDGRTWGIPGVEERSILFRGHVYDKAELAQDLLHSEAFQIASNMLYGNDPHHKLHRPLLPFRRTHMATLIASGVLNGAIGVDENRHMVVGMSRKKVTRDIVKKDDGTEVIVDSESYITAVRTIEANGTIRTIE